MRTPSARKLRSAVSNWWWCVSMKPGMTMRPLTSITAAPPPFQIRPDVEDRVAFDEDVGLGQSRRRLLDFRGSIDITDAAAKDIAPAWHAGAVRQTAGIALRQDAARII